MCEVELSGWLGGLEWGVIEVGREKVVGEGGYHVGELFHRQNIFFSCLCTVSGTKLLCEVLLSSSG